ncbi:hypothetical protein, partial [Ligilactobacillus ruminis]|uniref:hypothetical protein n=1 Tax=Ligilactobacillus ruminis TaxID=1623 RepID=UPI001CDC6140
NIFPIFWIFVLLLVPRGSNLVAAVEHFFNFRGFCSTFGAARLEFGGGGRTFFQFSEFLFYFRSRTPQIWWRR